MTKAHHASNNEEIANLVQNEIYLKMSWTQKWNAFQQLRDTAWALKVAGVHSRHPDWTPQQVHEEVKRIFLYATT